MNKTIDNQLKYGEISIKTYNVNTDDNNILTATESTCGKSTVETKKRYDEEFNLLNYIDTLHSKAIKDMEIDIFDNIGAIEYNEDYLVVLEYDYNFLTKKIFDLRNIELPEKTKQEIIEIQEHLKNNKNSTSIGKYIPLIHGIIDNKTIPLIKKEEEKDLKSFYEKTTDVSNRRRYNRDRDKPTTLKNYYLLSTYLIIGSLAQNKNIANFYNEHFIISTAGFVGLALILYRLYDKIDIGSINESINSDFNDYLELCHKITSGDKEAIKSLTEDIGLESTYNNTNNTDFYLSLVRDLTILDCYKDESLTPIKIELVSLGCEYVEYRSTSSEKEMVEEIFMKKLKTIEEKIDLTNKILKDKDNDTMNFITTHCDFDEDNHLRLIPIVNNQKELIKQYI